MEKKLGGTELRPSLGARGQSGFEAAVESPPKEPNATSVKQDAAGLFSAPSRANPPARAGIRRVSGRRTQQLSQSTAKFRREQRLQRVSRENQRLRQGGGIAETVNWRYLLNPLFRNFFQENF